jgi:hypothetical protein
MYSLEFYKDNLRRGDWESATDWVFKCTGIIFVVIPAAIISVPFVLGTSRIYRAVDDCFPPRGVKRGKRSTEYDPKVS